MTTFDELWAKQTARLKNWVLESVGPGSYWLLGNVYGHPQFEDGKHVHTSLVLAFEPGHQAETLNTFYQLENALGQPETPEDSHAG